jgi:hypothetical protein
MEIEKLIEKYKRDWKKYGMASTISYSDVIADLEQALQLRENAVSGSLTIQEVAAKYGKRVKCLFFDYDNEWKEKEVTVTASFLKDLEQGAVKDCH